MMLRPCEAESKGHGRVFVSGNPVDVGIPAAIRARLVDPAGTRAQCNPDHERLELRELARRPRRGR
jgi:hypothetical protein